mmetsp:Transcript_18091/g.37606  ORF Transcript_18091/g.37606 Transcript_18091/m.37606 type:complete len:249 (-) Transcript_18091:2259-3005(-)
MGAPLHSRRHFYHPQWLSKYAPPYLRSLFLEVILCILPLFPHQGNDHPPSVKNPTPIPLHPFLPPYHSCPLYGNTLLHRPCPFPKSTGILYCRHSFKFSPLDQQSYSIPRPSKSNVHEKTKKKKKKKKKNVVNSSTFPSQVLTYPRGNRNCTFRFHFIPGYATLSFLGMLHFLSWECYTSLIGYATLFFMAVLPFLDWLCYTFFLGYVTLPFSAILHFLSWLCYASILILVTLAVFNSLPLDGVFASA